MDGGGGCLGVVGGLLGMGLGEDAGDKDNRDASTQQSRYKLR